MMEGDVVVVVQGVQGLHHVSQLPSNLDVCLFCQFPLLPYDLPQLQTPLSIVV